MAVASGTAGLAGHRIRAHGLGREGDAEADRDERDVPAVVEGDAGTAQRDPENRLLARGPRFRLPAEMIRDQALSSPGLLVEKMGGPSVKPYQPDGLWKELAMQDMYYVQSKGAGSLSPQPVHLLEADHRAADDDEFRFGAARERASCARTGPTRRCRR